MPANTTHTPLHTDVAIVGAGILGLAHAYAFARRGLRVSVFERSGTPLGASIRNFGMVLVTGQPPGMMHTLARASRDIWLDWTAGAGLHVRRSRLADVARSETEARVMEAFAATRPGNPATPLHSCRVLRSMISTMAASARHRAALHGHDDLQVFSREAVPALIDYLRRVHGVEFRFGTLGPGHRWRAVETSAGRVACGAHCRVRGARLLVAACAATRGAATRACRLQMLRVRPTTPFALDHAVLTGLSCLHYGAFSDLPEAAALREEVASREPALLEHGIHLLASPTPYGDLIVGDSHDCGEIVAVQCGRPWMRCCFGSPRIR